jgi:SSS family solute:Na+ symporter
MIESASVVMFLAVLGCASLLAFTVRWFWPAPELPNLESWALADHRFGTPVIWFLLGGTIYTAYTFVAVPGLVHGVGGLGFFALPYTVIVYPLAFVVLPRFWTVLRRHRYITVADYVSGRYGSPALAVAVAVTGILATMPYLALQLLGIRALLAAGGVYPSGIAGDLALVAVFAVLAVATYRHGLRAPAVLSLAKATALFCSVLAVFFLVLHRLGGPGPMFDKAARALPATSGTMVPAPGQYTGYATLALGSALALVMYPHVLTAASAASSPDVLRRATVFLPAWTALLGLFALLGIAALAAGIQPPPGHAEAALPLLIKELTPAALTGLIFGALAVGALVPAAVMSIAVATLFVRNLYVPYFHPTATPKHQTRIARLVSIIAKAGAVVFVFGLRDQAAINLQLLGGVWILQTFPTVALGLFTSRLHHAALLTGWTTGMVTGTFLIVNHGFSPVASVGPATQAYVAVLALVLNLIVAVALTPLLDRAGVGRGPDLTSHPSPHPLENTP